MDTDSDPLEILTRVPNDMEAALIVNALQECGLRAMAAGGFTAGFQAEAPGDVQVYVLKSTLEQARQVLAEWKRSAAEDPFAGM
jgi:cytosine/adenosine deaminase-related metal-dependent hydrolase